jgi:hypothetical protein
MLVSNSLAFIRNYKWEMVLVLEIDFPETPEKVDVSRAACAHCDMIVLSAPVARILFNENLRSAIPEIIKAYDLTD